MAVIVMVCLLRSHCQAHLTPAAPLSYTECNYKSDKQLSIHFIQVSKRKKVARSPGERQKFLATVTKKVNFFVLFCCRGCCANQTSVVCFECVRKYMSPENAKLSFHTGPESQMEPFPQLSGFPSRVCLESGARATTVIGLASYLSHSRRPIRVVAVCLGT